MWDMAVPNAVVSAMEMVAVVHVKRHYDVLLRWQDVSQTRRAFTEGE